MAKPIKIAENGKEIPFDEYMFYCRLCQDYVSETHYCKQRMRQPELYIHCPDAKYTKLAEYIIKRTTDYIFYKINEKIDSIEQSPSPCPVLKDSIKNFFEHMESWVNKC